MACRKTYFLTVWLRGGSKHSFKLKGQDIDAETKWVRDAINDGLKWMKDGSPGPYVVGMGIPELPCVHPCWFVNTAIVGYQVTYSMACETPQRVKFFRGLTIIIVGFTLMYLAICGFLSLVF